MRLKWPLRKELYEVKLKDEPASFIFFAKFIQLRQAAQQSFR